MYYGRPPLLARLVTLALAPLRRWPARSACAGGLVLLTLAAFLGWKRRRALKRREAQLLEEWEKDLTSRLDGRLP